MEVQETYGDDVVFIGMPGEAGIDAMAGFVKENGVDGFAHIPDLDGALWEQFGVDEHRVYVYLNDDGTFRMGGYGNLDAEVAALVAS